MTTMGLVQMHACSVLSPVEIEREMCACNAIRLMMSPCFLYACQFLTKIMIDCCMGMWILRIVIILICQTYVGHVLAVFIRGWYVQVCHLLTVVGTICKQRLSWVLEIVITATPDTHLWVCTWQSVCVMNRHNEKRGCRPHLSSERM